MTVLSRKADYALVILSQLASQRESSTARSIAEKFGLSRAFVANILKELCQGDYVVSQRGVHGGYTLHPDALRKTLAELLAVIQEEFRLTVCTPGDVEHEPCSLENDCPVKGPLNRIQRRLIDVLKSVTLQELFAMPHDHRVDIGVEHLPIVTVDCLN